MPDKNQEDELFKAFIALIPLITRSSKARVVGIFSLRRLLMHTFITDYHRLSSSTLGQWCLQSLRSSSREIRIAATTSLRPFIRDHPAVDFDVTYNNRVVGLDFLQTLWAKNDTAVQETVVLALTQMAQVCGDEELNIILVRLVEYLGHSNPYVSGLVYGELQKLAQSLNLTPASLLRPFWRTIGVTVIKNLQTRPVIAQQLCDLLGLKVEGLLIMIEEFALPYLVLTGRRDVILRIALAHGPTMSPFDLCTQRKNLAPILSFLLAQPFSDSEEMIMSLLAGVSQDFRDHDLSSWVKLEPAQTACDLLKDLAEADDAHKGRAHQALLLLARLDQRKPGPSSGSKRSDVLGNFLEANILGVVTVFTTTLNDIEVRKANVEKRRCLAAIGEVIRLGKSRIVTALPQICACLRSAMEDKDLSNKAFGSWATMMASLREEDIESLVDQTLAIIVRGWDTFRTDTQQLAYTVVSDLLKKHTSLIREIFNTMPSLASIPLMTKLETEIGTLKRQMDVRHELMAFIKRLQSENVAVVEQALKELVEQLAQKQDFVYRSILREQPEPFVADLTRSLLDCCVRFNAMPSVSMLCPKCIGQIACLDPNKVESTREKKSILVFSNFAKADETVDFIIFFLEQVLVKAFLSATNAKSQGFLAWAMQELLKLCDLNESVTLRSRISGLNATYRRWLDLSEVVRNTLTPFLTSRYMVNAVIPTEIFRRPFFQPGLRHGDWIRAIVLDLLQKGSGENAQMIFSICARVIKAQDVSIPTFLLPFVVLNVVIGGTEREKDHIVEELLVILQEQLTGDHSVDENIKLCSESVFDVLDHMTMWVQQRKKQVTAALGRMERGLADPSLEIALAQIKGLESILGSVPPDLISRRAIDCKSYARALLHWEQYIRQRKREVEKSDELLERLQEIYTQIDEPDGIEGISAQLHVPSIDQQILEHRKAGRWTAAQTWYELQLNVRPEDPELQFNLMTCLRESGQYGE